MDTVKVHGLGKKFIISHEKEALARSMFPLLFRPAHKEELWALKDVTFGLKKGESLGVVGLNGAGKTVLLNVLSGITAPTEGEVKTKGRISTILTLGAGFHQELTGEENIFLNATILGMTAKEIGDKFGSIVDFCELGSFIDAPIQTYSAGMLMRLGFSIAVHADFDILLADEIISVGDLKFREKSLNKLREFRKQGKNIILASQEVGLIREIADKAVYLRAGRIEAFGDSDRVTRIYEESAARGKSVRIDKDYVSQLVSQKKINESPDKLKDAWGMRFTSGSAEITDVRIYGKDKKESKEFEAGGPLGVEVRYRINNEIRDPHFGVAFFREDRVYCHGPNTRFDNLRIEKLVPGEGSFSIYYPCFLLSKGAYFMSVAIWNRDERTAHDYHCAMYKIIVNGRENSSLFNQHYEENIAALKPLHRAAGQGIEARLIDRKGVDRDVFRTKEYLKISVDVCYERPARDFSLKVFNENGTACFVMNKRLRPRLTGMASARIVFSIPELCLLTGRYHISAEIKDKKGRVLARKDRLMPFSVFSEENDHGIVYMDHKWNINEAAYVG